MMNSRAMTLSDVMWSPASRNLSWLRDVLFVLGGSALIAASAQVVIPLPFTPVPITGQTFAVLLVGIVLGSKRGAASVLAYLAEGAMGLPVFAGASFGYMKFVGPTGGYLMGFVFGAFLAGWLAERTWDRTPLKAMAAMFLGSLVILSMGAFVLSFFVGAKAAVMTGIVPFLPGDVIKIGLAGALLPSIWKLTKKSN